MGETDRRRRQRGRPRGWGAARARRHRRARLILRWLSGVQLSSARTQNCVKYFEEKICCFYVIAVIALA